MATLIELKAKLDRERIKEESRKEIKAIGKEAKIVKRELRAIKFRKVTGVVRGTGKAVGIAGKGVLTGIGKAQKFFDNRRAMRIADEKRRIQLRRKRSTKLKKKIKREAKIRRVPQKKPGKLSGFF